jgi:hypothetical protein
MRTTLVVCAVGCTLSLAIGTARSEPLPIFIEERASPPDPIDTGAERFLQIGPVAMPGWAGLRAQLDIFAFGGLSIGAAGTALANGVLDDGAGVHLSGVGYLAYTANLTPRFRLRGQIGYGAAYNADVDTTRAMMVTSTPELVDLSLLLVVRGNHDWSGIVGPVVQRTETGDTTTMLFAGLSWRY